MIFFSGWGAVLVPLFGIAGLIVGTVAGRISNHPDIAIALAGLVAASLTWNLGRRLNHPKNDKTVFDPKTDQQLRRKRRHNLMFVPIQYYAFLYGLIAVFGFLVVIEASAKEPKLPSDAQRLSQNTTDDKADNKSQWTRFDKPVKVFAERPLLVWVFHSAHAKPNVIQREGTLLILGRLYFPDGPSTWCRIDLSSDTEDPGYATAAELDLKDDCRTPSR